MGLYLSSYRIPNPGKLRALIGKDLEDSNGVLITNAKENRTPEEQDEKFNALKSDLSAIGLRNTVRVNLRDGSVDLDGVDYVLAAGGNTFDLRRAMQDTGFDEIVRGYVQAGGVYVGESAGAIVAGPSLRGFETMDEPPEDPVWDGIGLTDAVIVPHNDSSDPAFNNRAPSIQLRNPNLSVIALNDDQDYVVN